MKKCTLCSTTVIGNTCPNCGMRTGDSSQSIGNNAFENKFYQDEAKNSKKEKQSYNKQFTNNKSRPSFNTSNKPKFNKNKLIFSLISIGIVLAIDAFEGNSYPEPVQPEPDYDYSQVMENIENYNENNQNNFDEILEDIELPDTGNLNGEAYWQSEYDFMNSYNDSEIYNVRYYQGTHIVGLDIPEGDYELAVENAQINGMPLSIKINGKDLEIEKEMNISLSDGDIFQYIGGYGFTLYSTNHQYLTFLDEVLKNEEFYYYTVSDEEVVVERDFLANTYDIISYDLDDVLVQIDYPDGYIISDFEVILTADDNFFDNVMLPEGTRIAVDGTVDFDVSPFNVDSIIS